MASIDSKITRSSSSQTVAGTGTNAGRTPPVSTVLSKTPVGTAGGFDKGQILKGEIIDLRDRDVKIQLTDSRVITAHLDTGTTLSIGSRASFQVTETSLSSMSLKILAESAPITGEQMVDKALEEAGLPHTERNISVVRALLANQMSINKSSIQNVLKQAAVFQNASVETLVLMNKYHLPMTQVTTSQFEAYRNYEHRIVSQIQSLAEGLLSGEDGCTSKLPLAEHILELLSGSGSPTETSLEASKETTPFSLFDAPVAQSLDTPVGTLLSQDSLLSLTDLLDSPELPDSSRIRLLNGEAGLSETARLILDAAVREDGSLADATAPEIIASLPESLSNADVYTVVNQYQTLLHDTLAPGFLLSSRQSEALALDLKEAGIPESLSDQVRTGDISGKELLALLKYQLDTGTAGTSKKLFGSSELQTVLKELLTAHWTLTPKTLMKPHALEQYYEKLDRELAELMKFSSQDSHQESGFQDGRGFQNMAQNVRDNIDFMKTLNQIFTYVQLPMRLSKQNVHSELYVYTRKNQRQEDRQKLHVLLHLDMERLGLLDIHLNLNGRILTAQFYVEDPDTAPVLSEHMDLLTEVLNKKGFSFLPEVLKREKPVDLVRDFIAPDEPESEMKRYTFDVRA